MACTNPQNPSCPNCNKTGLAILPVRYAVVPSDVKATLPASLGNKVTDVKLAHHQYALRTLRQGFVYLFHERHPRGSQIKWEVYSVSPEGTLWKQPAITAIKPVSDDPACSRSGHNLPASIIAIDKPEKCGKVWMAFSEHAWSADTFKLFESDATLRDKRMQIFLPATWIKAKGYRHGLEGTQANVEQVIEYQNGFNAASLTGGVLTDISEVDGKHKVEKLKKQTTRSPLHMRKDQSKQVAEVMKTVGEQADGKDNPPIVLALWDAVGITHELNGFRNDAAGWIEKYGRERELEITAMNAIEGIKKALEDKAGASADVTARQMNQLPRHDLDAQETHARIMYRDNPAQLQAELDKIKQEHQARNARRDTGQADYKRKNMAHSWEKYQAKLENDGATFNTFKQNYQAFLTAADQLIDQRTDDLIVWLESTPLIHAFTEFHVKNIDDGVVFDDQVGTAMHGINSSVKGKAKIDAWVKEMKASETNLLWRAIALNQEEGITEVNAAMAASAAYSAPVGKMSVDFLTTHIRKMADIYKKANTVQSTLLKAGDAAERIKKIKVTDFDRLFMTVGDRLFKPFLQRGVDTGSEFAVRGLMLARAGVEPERIIDALKVQAKQEGLARSAIVRRLQAARTFIGSGQDFKDAKYAELQKKWQDLKANPGRGAIALKENRLSLIVATLEIINLTKIAWEFKDDKRTYGELAAAALSTTAAVADIGANAAKHLVGDKVSVTFQQLKATSNNPIFQ